MVCTNISFHLISPYIYIYICTLILEDRATSRQKERLQNAEERQKIRKPKGSRTFGQLRLPEQILKQRKLREKQKQRAQKNRNNNQSHKKRKH